MSDLHVNSSVAVCPLTVNLDDGGTYHASRTQQWLWRCINEIAEEARAVPAERRLLVLNGDLGELDTKRRSIQLVTQNKATILGMTIDVITPLLGICDAFYVVRGTPAHTGKSCWLETAIGEDIGAVPDPKTGAASWWHIRSTCDGVRLDIAHHASMGRSWWTKRNAANSLAAKIVIEYMVDMGQPPPHLAFRAHNHTYADSSDNYRTRVVYGGALTTLTEFGYRCGFENSLAEIGGWSAVCEDGKYEIKRLQCEPRRERLWALSM